MIEEPPDGNPWLDSRGETEGRGSQKPRRPRQRWAEVVAAMLGAVLAACVAAIVIAATVRAVTWTLGW